MAGDDLGRRVAHGEVLRALGRRLDAWGWYDIRLDARGPALALAGRSRASRRVERRILPLDDMPAFLGAMWPWRGAPLPGRGRPPHPGGLGYQEALRLLGQRLDRRGARLVRVIEHPAGLIVQRLPPGAIDTGLTTELVRWEVLQALHLLLVGGRR